MANLQMPQISNRLKYFIIIAIVAVFLLAITAPSEAPSEEAIIEGALASTVTIHNDVALGSGVIIGGDDKESWILTNRHVVDPDLDGSGAPNQIVTMQDGRTFYPSAILIPPYDGIDLAYVTISLGNAPIANIDYNYAPKTAENVAAVGSPLGLENTVTTGIVSAVRYTTSESGYKTEVIQTSAPINHGNSGGGLFSLKTGNLLGINSFGPPEEANSQGIGFAYSIKLFGDLPKNNWRSLDLSPPSYCRANWEDEGLEKIEFGECSQFPPWWCNPSAGDVEERADLCGCPSGYSASGEECVATQLSNEQIMQDTTITLESGFMWYYGGDVASLSTSETLHYIVSSNLPVNIDVVPSKQDFRDALQGLDYNTYPSCSASNVYSYDKRCTLDKNGGILIDNSNAASATIHVVVKTAG
ncbi:MAG: trypsin-like peptidase domain-containing protein [Candidatus Micrarchaeota archaeon]